MFFSLWVLRIALCVSFSMGSEDCFVWFFSMGSEDCLYEFEDCVFLSLWVLRILCVFVSYVLRIVLCIFVYISEDCFVCFCLL